MSVAFKHRICFSFPNRWRYLNSSLVAGFIFMYQTYRYKTKFSKRNNKKKG